jgi:hypothetical protein
MKPAAPSPSGTSIPSARRGEPARQHCLHHCVIVFRLLGAALGAR